MYYKITASGILGAWRPSIQLPALTAAQIAAGQNYVSADWTSDGGANWHTFGLASGNTVRRRFRIN